eukprot:scaffold42523_cov63-Phaeocystis_antarctica.AAC.1
MHPAQAIQLRPWVRFEQGVYDAAAAFVAKTFGTEPFVAIHWRRTDFLTARPKPGVLQSPAELMRHARALMKQHGVAHVYLATDNTDGGEMARVNAGLQPTRLEPPAEAAESLRARAVHANVEIAICAMADYFLGTQTSSFSLAITEERQAVFGHAAGTGAEMGLLPSPNQPPSPPSPPSPRLPPSPPQPQATSVRALMFYLDLAMRLKRTLVCHVGLEPQTSRPQDRSATHTCEARLGQVLPRARLLRRRLPSEARTYHGF